MNLFSKYKKTFKHKTKDKIPSIETSFGSHSKKKHKIPSIETSFGSHSKKKTLSEDVSPVIKSHELSRAEQEEAHLHTAPIHDDKLNADEKEAVSDYTDNSTPLNGMLHDHDKGRDISRKEHDASKNTATHLDSALDKHKTTADMHVFTGIKFSPAKHFKKVAGKIPTTQKLHMPAYTSTSTKLGVASGFSDLTSHPNDERHGVNSEDDEKKHVLKIHVPAGSHAMSVRSHSFVEGENEILLHRGHTIEVHHEPTRYDHNTFIWHAKVVDHNKADISKPSEE